MALTSALPGQTRLGRPGSQPDPRLEQLSRTYGPGLYRFLLRATAGHRQLAGELTRATLRRAWPILQPLGPDVDDAEAWLLTIARRVALDHLRMARDEFNGVAAIATPSDAASTADIVVDGRALRTALGRLGSEQRRVVVEMYGRGRSVAETARMLGMPTNAVRQRAYRALRALRANDGGPASGDAVVA